jgi:hypothetical protein
MTNANVKELRRAARMTRERAEAFAYCDCARDREPVPTGLAHEPGCLTLVLLAVADWLGTEADYQALDPGDSRRGDAALAVARASLGW